MIIRTLVLTNSYYDRNEEDNDVFVRPCDDGDSVTLESGSENVNGVQIRITREELLVILDLIPVR